MVGVEGFEPPTFCSQSRRATRLRYTPKQLPTSIAVVDLKGKRFDAPHHSRGAHNTHATEPRQRGIRKKHVIAQLKSRLLKI